MKLGIDLDGVVCDFDSGFHLLLEDIGNRRLPHPGDPPVWNWPQAVCGCSDREVSKAWQTIRKDPTFWAELRAICTEDVKQLRSLQGAHSLYFVTSRVPELAKHETEHWLVQHGIIYPTVLISRKKGPIAAGLELDAFIDDKVENLEDVVKRSPETRCYLLARKFNESSWKDKRWTTVTSLGEMLDMEVGADARD